MLTERGELQIVLRKYSLKEIVKNHRHNCIEILYFTSGNGAVICNLKKYDVKPGSLIIVNENESHSILTDSYLECYCITIDTSIFLDVSENNIVFDTYVSADEFVLSTLREMFFEYEKRNIGSEMMIKGSAYKLITHLIRNYGKITKKEYDSNAIKLRRLNDVLLYIEEHYCEKISTSFLAEYCFLSEYYFCHFFKKETGLTVIQYIKRLRVQKSINLLRNTTMSITEIAAHVGFNDINYYCRVFKKIMGTTPKSVRQLH